MVPGILLDDLVFKGNYPVPDVIKMDIEGGEVMAIKGMRQLLSKTHPLLLIELHGHEAAVVVGGALQEAGYRLFRMEDGYPEVSSPDELDWKSYVIGVWKDDNRFSILTH